MESIAFQEFLQYGTPGIIFMLLLSNVYLMVTINNIKTTLFDMKKNIVWKETCDQVHKSVDINFNDVKRRIDRLENQT